MAISGLNAIKELIGRLIGIPFGGWVSTSTSQNGIERTKTSKKNCKSGLSKREHVRIFYTSTVRSRESELD